MGPCWSSATAHASRLVQVLSAEADPSMPPEGEPRPGAEQIALLRRWIDEGAVGPSDADTPRQLVTPHIDPSPAPKPITAMACAPSGQRLAIGRFQAVEIVTPELQFVQRLAAHPGKVNAIAFSPDGTQLFTATGVTGLFGETWIWDLRRNEVTLKLGGHADAVYAIACSPDGKWLATAGYDRTIQIWQLPLGTLQRTLTGHNGPVFDLAFAPNSRLLASARPTRPSRSGMRTPANASILSVSRSRNSTALTSAPTASSSWLAAPTTACESGVCFRSISHKSIPCCSRVTRTNSRSRG